MPKNKMPPIHIPKEDSINLYGIFEGTIAKCPNVFRKKCNYPSSQLVFLPKYKTQTVG